MREETECEHKIFRKQWDRRFEDFGPLSGNDDVDEIYYAKDPAALRRVFHDSVSEDALRLEAWIQSHR